jgi:hypothetical protein
MKQIRGWMRTSLEMRFRVLGPLHFIPGFITRRRLEPVMAHMHMKAEMLTKALAHFLLGSARVG